MALSVVGGGSVGARRGGVRVLLLIGPHIRVVEPGVLFAFLAVPVLGIGLLLGSLQHKEQGDNYGKSERPYDGATDRIRRCLLRRWQQCVVHEAILAIRGSINVRIPDDWLSSNLVRAFPVEGPM